MASSNASALNQLCVTIWLDENIQLGLPWQLLLLYCEKTYSLFKCLVSKWMLVSIWHVRLGFTLYLCAHDFSCFWAFVFWSVNYWFCLPYVYPVVVWWLRLSCTFWLCVWKFWETKKTRPSTELSILLTWLSFPVSICCSSLDPKSFSTSHQQSQRKLSCCFGSCCEWPGVAHCRCMWQAWKWAHI